MTRPTMGWTALAALAMALAVSSCSRRPDAAVRNGDAREQAEASDLVSKPAPDFTLKAVLGVAFDDDGWNAVKPYITEHKINYRIMVGDDALDKAYGGIESLPTTFIIGRDGRVVSRHVGLISKSTYDEEIARLLKEKAPENIGLLREPVIDDRVQ